MSRTNLQNPGRPGFQGSETSSAEVVIYHREDDPVLFKSIGRTQATGRFITDEQSCLTAVTTTKGVGGEPGTFSFNLFEGGGDKLLDRIVDDDWVDITFKRHGRQWHTMRGIVDEIREASSVGSRGATTVIYTVTGRDITKIWKLTPIWFNRFTLENVAGGVAYQVLSADNIGGYSVEETVQRFLREWLEPLGDYGRANWLIPKTVPNFGGQSFLSAMAPFVNPNVNDPRRLSLSTNFMAPQGTAWDLAKEWSDPLFTELFADTYLDDAALGSELISQNSSRLISEGYGPADTKMGYILRGKPFVEAPLGLDSPWFDLPLHTVAKQDVDRKDVGRGGHERYNAFFVGPQTTQEAVATGIMDLATPLWDEEDILIHGLRRFDVESRYEAPDGSSTALTLAPFLRQKLRDWYAINPYLFNGTITLGVGRPDIRAGTRVLIPGATRFLDEMYYVEEVTNAWTMGVGLRTNMLVTRGWRGTMTDYVQTVRDLADKYRTPLFATPHQAVATVGFA